MELSLLCLELESCTDQRVWTFDGLPVLEAEAELPRPVNRNRQPEKRLERFYQLQLRSWFQYCERFLFPKALESCRAALENAQPMPDYRAALSYKVTMNRDGFLSLYTQAREVCGGCPFLTRFGDTWWLPCCAPVPLHVCFPKGTPVRKLLCGKAAEEIQRQEKAGAVQYSSDWRKKLRRHWNARNFYLTDEGLSFFWPMYALAPATAGIPVFSLPYSECGCQLPKSDVFS